MLIDLHCHTSGISRCCLLPPDEICKRAKEVGLDAICLTNHYCYAYVKESGNFDEWIEKYIKEYEKTKLEGEKIGLKVFFGAEITYRIDERIHLLVYGQDFDFMRKNKNLFDLTQKELYALCKENDLALIQAHPFRSQAPLLDTDYLDGIEINCHPMYPSTHSAELEKISSEKGLRLTCGCDYHGDTPYRAKGGTYVSDDVSCEQDLARFLLTTDKIKLKIQEINAPAFYEKDYFFKKK